MKPKGRVDSHTSTNALVGGGDAGSKGALGKQISGLTGITQKDGWDLPLGLSILVGWEVSPAASIASCLSVGGPSTQLNIVEENGQQTLTGSSILRPSNMSPLVIFTNSHTA